MFGFRLGRGVQKSPQISDGYGVKIVGIDRQVKNGQKTSDVIYGRSQEYSFFVTYLKKIMFIYYTVVYINT